MVQPCSDSRRLMMCQRLCFRLATQGIYYALHEVRNEAFKHEIIPDNSTV